AAARAKSISYYKRALDLLDARVYRASAAQLYHNLGLAHFRAHNYPLAQQYFETGKAIAVELQDTFGIAFYDYRLGMLAKQEQRYDDALTFIENALPIFVERGRTNMMLQAHLARAEILAAENHRKESLDALANARALLPRLASSAREASYYDRAAAVYARNGQFQQAFGQMAELRDVEQRRAEDANS